MILLCSDFASAAFIYAWDTLINIKGSMENPQETEKGNESCSPGETEKVPEASFLAVGRLPVPVPLLTFGADATQASWLKSSILTRVHHLFYCTCIIINLVLFGLLK